MLLFNKINKLTFNQTVCWIFIFGNLLLGFLDGAILHGIAHIAQLLKLSLFLKVLISWIIVWFPQIFYIVFSIWIVNKKSDSQSPTNKTIIRSTLIIYVLLCLILFLLTSTFSPLTYIGSNIYGYIAYGATSFNLIPASIKYYSSTYLGG